MLFNSVSFLIFFPLVLLFYFLIPGKWRCSFLLLASLLFYMSFHPKYVVVLMFVTIVSYFEGLWLERIAKTFKEDLAQKRKQKRLIFFGSIVTVSAALVLFKYTEFLLDNVNRVLALFSLKPVSGSFSFVLPLGISYFTFQVIGYLTDIYRGEQKAEHDFVVYALYVSFFPKMLSGPIERGGDFLPQLHACAKLPLWDGTRVMEGIIRMVLGYFQKMVIADRLAIFTGEIFGNYMLLGSVELFAGAAAFYLQLYTDFAGCINIAMGMAKIMGFSLTENFDAPFFAGSIREYWARWHMSLSSWLRDYIYIPLGGNRKGTLLKYRNLMITFLVSGLWHGAGWQYILWGAVHGGYQILEYVTAPVIERVNGWLHTKTESFSYRLLQKVKCWLLVCFAHVFFKVPSGWAGLHYLGRMFTKWDPWVLFDKSLYGFGVSENYSHFLWLAVIFLMLVEYLKYKRKLSLDVWLTEQCIWFRWLVVMGMLMTIIICGVYGAAYEAKNFIYFQF